MKHLIHHDYGEGSSSVHGEAKYAHSQEAHEGRDEGGVGDAGHA